MRLLQPNVHLVAHPVGKPIPLVALACSSRSTRSVRLPFRANAADKFFAVVVLPTPPLCIAIAIFRAMKPCYALFDFYKFVCCYSQLYKKKLVCTSSHVYLSEHNSALDRACSNL